MIFYTDFNPFIQCHKFPSNDTLIYLLKIYIKNQLYGFQFKVYRNKMLLKIDSKQIYSRKWIQFQNRHTNYYMYINSLYLVVIFFNMSIFVDKFSFFVMLNKNNSNFLFNDLQITALGQLPPEQLQPNNCLRTTAR